MISQKDIPNHWDIKRIEDVVLEAKNGGTPKRSNDDYWGGSVPWLSSSEVRGKYTTSDPEEYITQTGLKESSAVYWSKGSVLVAMYGRGTIGRSAIAGADITGNQAICGLVCDDEMINNDFLYYWLTSIRNQLADKGRGATASRQNLNRRLILETKVPVPPLGEQEQIVEVVEKRLKRMERLKKSVGDISRLTQEYENSLLTFLTIGKDVTDKTAVGGIPKQQDLPDEWDVVQLSKVADVNPRISYDEQEDYAYVPMDAVSADEKTITRYERRESLYSGLAKFSEGDIIVARITPCFENGKMAVVSELPSGYEFAVGSTEFVVIRPDGIDPEYLFSYLKSPIVRRWGERRLLGSTGRERIKISQFRDELSVPVPPKETQSDITQAIKENDFSKIRTSVISVQSMFEEYENSVLANATRGNI
ncbi:restriction endonuclease subunit S [Halobacterium salinarum]|uniref:restriction endonuclease subunit S n=1 Tax=Halobacterium salinarum TaxID=2242 RepID=UPI002554D423|nr:restriction endonuclease subunit S [Halobacterium salinarum]MDL0144532.1 restriction endonuclease subunit S [Halobacterium salinarum]